MKLMLVVTLLYTLVENTLNCILTVFVLSVLRTLLKLRPPPSPNEMVPSILQNWPMTFLACYLFFNIVTNSYIQIFCFIPL